MTQTTSQPAAALSAKWQPYPAYKDSGVEWLGEIPAHWEVKRLKNTVLVCQNGMWGDEPVNDGTDIVCVRVADFDRTKNRVVDTNLTFRSFSLSQLQGRILERGTLLLEKSGGGELQPVGVVVLYDLDILAVCSNFIARMPVARGYDPLFLCYLHSMLYSIRLNTRSIKQNTGIQNLDSYAYLCEQVSLPPLSEQRAIAAFLDRETERINALIAKKEQLIALLQEKRAALISQAVTKGLDPAVKMKDSGVAWLGEIPAHWEVKRLKFVADVLNGVAKGRDLGDRDVVELPYLRVANVQDGFLDLSDIATIMVGLDEVERYSLQPGDVLMNEGGDFDKLGRGYVWNGEITLCLHQNHVFAVRPHPGIDPYWISLITLTNYAKHYFILRSKQSTNLASISATNLKELPVLVPPDNERALILDHIKDTTAKIDALIGRIREGIAKVQEYSAALIAAAVTGKIDVRDAV
jgi:type I restriction enzyme S subunit